MVERKTKTLTEVKKAYFLKWMWSSIASRQCYHILNNNRNCLTNQVITIFWFFVDRLSNMTELDRSPPYNSWTSPSTEIVEYNIFRGFKYQMLWSFVSKAVHFFKAFIYEGIMFHNRRVLLLYEIVRKPHHMWYIKSSSGKIQVALSKLGRQRNPDAETVPMERQRTSLGEMEKERNRDP